MDCYLDGKPMDAVAIERIKAFEAEALAMHPDGFFLAHSGGKDSCVIHDLAKRAGVKFTAHHSHTTADAPELVRFVRSLPDVEIHLPPRDETGRRMTMWRLIRKKGMPPRRTARFCCEKLKEIGGAGRFLILGVRWGESTRRAKTRDMVESCYHGTHKRFLNPIIDWTTAQVWRYIRERRLPYCPLYDEGFARVGCVLCPMTRDTARQIARWPRLAAAWERAIKATFKPDQSFRFKFKTADEYWKWWLDRDAPSAADPDTPRLFYEEPEEPEEPTQRPRP